MNALSVPTTYRDSNALVHELKTLQQAENHEEASSVVADLVTSAVRDVAPTYTVRQIFSAITAVGAKDLLDPLGVLPALVNCKDTSSEDLLSLVAECTSAKEVIIAAQEALEQLHMTLDNYDSEAEDEESQTSLDPTARLIRLLYVYAAAIPRIRLRKKAASETLKPIFDELNAIFTTLASIHNANRCREATMAMSQLISAASRWIHTYVVTPDDVEACEILLLSVWTATVCANASSLESSLAARRFVHLNPRMSRQVTPNSDWEAGFEVMSSLKETYEALSSDPKELFRTPSIASLLLVAHSPELLAQSRQPLADMLSVLMSCLHTNNCLDSVLAYLLSVISLPNSPIIDPGSAYGLSYSLALVSAAHPDSTVRLITFKVLAMTMSLSPDTQQLVILQDLLRVSDETPPQLRVAAVGLARDVVLRALASTSPSPLASPMMIQLLGPLLFQSNPHDLFLNVESLNKIDFLESIEPKRLTECLGFYYVISRRDTSNRTGIQDEGQRKHVELTLFNPLRSLLGLLMQDAELLTNHDHTFTIAGLQIGLERIAS